ncbi:MAG: alpha-2-macroglobulin family protein, partial [Chloroflexota bacterium]|jgi:hypothetical protein
VESALRDTRAQGDWPWRVHILDTEGLERLRSQTATLERLDIWDGRRRALTLERPLPAGWYLLVVPPAEGKGPGSQLILQVTDLSAYAHVSTTDSLFWVNDVRSGRPVEGAEVRLVDGPLLGLTDAEGILEIETPTALSAHQPTPLVQVRTADKAVYVPFVGGSWSGPNVESWGQEAAPHDLAWSFFNTDREAYRSTDTVNVWGMHRDREDGSVPVEVQLRLHLDWDEIDFDEPRPPDVATATATPSADGVYSGSLSFEDLPLGYYVVEAEAEGETVGLTWVEVRHIVKPAYRLDVSTNRRAYLAGDSVRVAVAATFFDGTPVPGAPLSIHSRRQWRSAATNATGRAVARVKARADDGLGGQLARQSIEARPRRPEEGEISSGAGIVVLPSARFLDARASRGNGQVRVSGSVHAVDLEKLERQIERDIDGQLDPRGAPVSGATVTARITETEWIRKQDGTTYDFISKQVIPVYRYEAKRRRLPAQKVLTDEDGAFSLFAPTTPGREYDVDLRTVDQAGRTSRIQRTAWRRSADRPWVPTWPYLFISEPQDPEAADRGFWLPPAYVEGERITVELRQGEEPQPRGGKNRYLFLIQQMGLQEAFLQRSPTHEFTFDASHAPSIDIGAVRFTGSTYVAFPRGVSAALDPESRRLTVELKPDRPRYEPGESVELMVRTTDGDGEVVPASVVLRAVDQKLYAMDLARDTDPLTELYAPIWSGLIRAYATHLLPAGSPEGADTGGGGDAASGGRSDFRDVVLFEQVRTDVDGEAHVTFDLSDDLTSWRVSASAVNDRIEAGETTTLVPVGLPFFVELVTAREFLVGDEARLRLRAYGGGLLADEPVTFTISAPTLGLEPTRVEATAFKTTSVRLPSLVEGRHDITVDGVVRDGAEDELHDRLTRSVTVRRSRLESGRTAFVELEGEQAIAGGDGLTTVVIADAGRGRFLPELASLVWADGPRADAALAAEQARLLLEDTFGEDVIDAPDAAFDREQLQAGNGLVALLPYASGEEWLSTLVAIAAPDAIDRAALLEALERAGSRRKVSRERRLQALAGQAALGADVLDRLYRYRDMEQLSTRERLLLGIGLAEAGDEAAALEIERELLARHGEQLGAWIRLWTDEVDATDAQGTGSPTKAGKGSVVRSPALEHSAELTALLSILAAAVGDDAVATAADAYVAANPPRETLANLQHVAVISRLLARAPSSPARFGWRSPDDGGQVDLGPGESHHLVLTRSQREALRLEPLSGSLVVASSWRAPLEADDLVQDKRITVDRSFTPDGTIRGSDTVEVTVTVELGPAAIDGCYLVTENAPSGMAPLRDSRSWRGGGRDAGAKRAMQPWSVEGQRVSWCLWPTPKRPVQTLGYRARVVNNGSYRWEPTLVQAVDAPELARLGPADTIVIGAKGAPNPSEQQE